jgi:hypothetical protein
VTLAQVAIRWTTAFMKAAAEGKSEECVDPQLLTTRGPSHFGLWWRSQVLGPARAWQLSDSQADCRVPEVRTPPFFVDTHTRLQQAHHSTAIHRAKK